MPRLTLFGKVRRLAKHSCIFLYILFIWDKTHFAGWFAHLEGVGTIGDTRIFIFKLVSGVITLLHHHWDWFRYKVSQWNPHSWFYLRVSLEGVVGKKKVNFLWDDYNGMVSYSSWCEIIENSVASVLHNNLPSNYKLSDYVPGLSDYKLNSYGSQWKWEGQL